MKGLLSRGAVRWVLTLCGMLVLFCMVRRVEKAAPAMRAEGERAEGEMRDRPEAEAPHGRKEVVSARSDEVAPRDVSAALGEPHGRGAATEQLLEWAKQPGVLDAEERAKHLERGIALARVRGERMRRLIVENAESALREALRWDEVIALPEEVRAFCETPFSEVADYRRIPVCPGSSDGQRTGGGSELAKIEFGDGTRLAAYPTGLREELGSKKGVPLQGVFIDGVAAVRGGVFQKLSAAEVEAVSGRFGSGQVDMGKSFASGGKIGAEPVLALAGGKLFAFASDAELSALDKALGELDLKPGPRSGAATIFALPYSSDGSGNALAFNLVDAQMAAAWDSVTWTTTPKTVFLIRVDFPDLPGAPVSKASAELVMNGSVNTSLVDMSYGKAGLIGTASEQVYRLSGGTATYAGIVPGGVASGTFSSNNDALLAAAKAAFGSAAKSGADASINLADYDVVGVSFAGIGCYNSGVKYAGLASIQGGDLWMQGSNEAKVYVHELGHVYGLGHSNFWQTADSSVVGAGEEKEYGDIYDVMGKGELPRGHFHPQAKQRLSWLDANQWADATAAGVSRTYRIYRHDDPLTTGSLRGVRITKHSAGVTGDEYYWIGYRAAYSDNSRMSGGAYLLWQRAGAKKSCLLDTTPLTSGEKSDAALDLGRTYEDSESGVRITPVSTGGSGGDQYLDVRVNLGEFAGNRQPVVSNISGASTVTARVASTFSVSSSDADGDTLSYFWDAGDAQVGGGTLGTSSSFSHAWTMGGTYQLSVTVSDMKGGVRTQSMSVGVDDGAKNFTPRVSGTAHNLNAIAASDTLLVSVGRGGVSGSDVDVIRTSPDGMVWTARPVTERTTNLNLKAVVWDGVRFTAVGEDYETAGRGWYGVIYTSATGLSWERVFEAPGAASTLNTVCAGGGKIVAAGDSQVVLVSGDGVQWSSKSFLPTGYAAGGLAYGSGIFALTAHASGFGFGDGLLYTSTDAVTWLERTSGMGLDPKSDLRTIAYLKDRFVGSGWFSKLKTSTDAAVSFSSTRQVYEEAPVLTYGAGLYFAAGLQRVTSGTGTTTAAVNLYSTDGIIWTGTSSASGSGVRNGGILFNGRIITVGNSGEIFQSDVVQTGSVNVAPVIASGSLVVQSPVAARTSVPFEVPASDVNGDTLHYHWDAGEGTEGNASRTFTHQWAVGGTYAVSVTVNDGNGGSVTKTEWVNVRDPLTEFSIPLNSGTQSFNGVAARGSLVVAVGDKGTVRTSSDGSNWTDRTITPSGNLYLHAVTWDGRRFTAVGEDVDASHSFLTGTIFDSSDGATWTRRYLAASNLKGLRSIASSGGTLLAGGISGTLLRSSDGGGSWTALSVPWLPSTHKVAAICYADSQFVVSAHRDDQGNNGTYNGEPLIYRSSDGLAWTGATSGAGLGNSEDIRSLAFLNGKLVGSGWYSKLRVSGDKGASFTSTRSAYEMTPALAYGNGVYFAGGVSQDEGDARVHVVSTDGLNWVSIRASSAITAEESGAVFFKNSFLVVGKGGLIAKSGTITASSVELSITTQPLSVNVTQGGGASLSVVATGAGPLTYQWKKDGTKIAGANSRIYQLGSASVADGGLYTVEVGDSVLGTVLTSDSVRMTVSPVGLGLVTQQPVASVSTVKGSSATASLSVKSANSEIDPVLQTTFGVYALGSSPALVGSMGIVPVSGVIDASLRNITSSGHYFVRVVRTYGSGVQLVSDSESFVVNLVGWESAAGTYSAMLNAGTGSLTGLSDGAAYRGLVTMTLTKTGALSGKVFFNEAPVLQSGTSGERAYQCVSRSFAGALGLKEKGGMVFALTPKLGTTAQAVRQALRLEVDMSAAVPAFEAVLIDKVSLPSGGTASMSSASGMTRVASSLGTLFSPLAGRYTVLADEGNASNGFEHNAYVVAQVLSSARVLWLSRLKGVSGSGVGVLKLGDPTEPSADFYEGRTSSATLLNTTSLLGEIRFRQVVGGSWRAGFGMTGVDGGLEKQASYVRRLAVAGTSTLLPSFDPVAFASGSLRSGVQVLQFSNGDGSRWSEAVGLVLPAFVPKAQVLTLSLADPLTGVSFSWRVTIPNTGVVSVVPISGAPTLNLRLDRVSGALSGAYTYLGSRRSLVGVIIDAGTCSSRVGRGWVEATVPAGLSTTEWVLIK